VHIPSAQAFDVSDEKLEAAEVERSHSIESDVEQDQTPLKEGVDSVCYEDQQELQVAIDCHITYRLAPYEPCAE